MNIIQSINGDGELERLKSGIYSLNHVITEMEYFCLVKNLNDNKIGEKVVGIAKWLRNVKTRERKRL